METLARVTQVRLVLWTVLTASSLFWAAPPPACASPWTLPEGTLALGLGFRAQEANSHYLSDGALEKFPLEGHQFSQDGDLRLRYGISDHIELELATTYKSLRYNANLACIDSTVTATSPDDYDCPATGTSASYGAVTILDFNRGLNGLADTEGHFKFQLIHDPVLLTIGPYVKIPGSYEPPGAVGEAPNDDLSLGDGQVDLGGFAYLGAYAPKLRTFARADLGYLHRFGTPGDQLVVRLRTGHQLHSRWLIATGVQAEWTITPGEEVGTEGIRIESDGTITRAVVFNEKDAIMADIACIIVADERTEFTFSAFRTLAGAYISNTTGIGLGLVRRFF